MTTPSQITKLELILVVLGFVGIGIFLATFAGGPIYSDELAFMNDSLNNVKDPGAINRYTHIYLQKPFLELAPTPLEGAKVYWSFLIASTGFLIYWCARILSRGSHIIHASLAALLFFSFHFLVDYSGVTIVDFTAMLMVMVSITVYILAAHREFSRPWLYALGFVFFLALKSKETAIALLVLLPGLGFVNGSEFHFNVLGKRLLYFLLGLLGGVLLFIIINTLLLHDPFFGFSPSSIDAFINTYANLPRSSIPPNTPGWYSGVIATIWLLPFILYLISGIRQNVQVSYPLRLLWVIPVAMVIFLTVMTLLRSYRLEPRFFFPALPVLCFLGAQLLPFELPSTKKDTMRFIFYIVLVTIVCVVINYAIRPLAAYMSQSFDDFLFLIFYPLTISILILAAFFIKRYTTITILIPLACILSMMITPIRTNIKYIAILHQNAAIVENRFHPFSVFADHLKPVSNMQFYVSSNLHQALSMLSTDVNEVNTMYNIYFDRNTQSTEFTISPATGKIPSDVIHGDYNYVLLTMEDWQKMIANPSDFAWYQEHYSIFEDPSQPIILLVKK